MQTPFSNEWEQVLEMGLAKIDPIIQLILLSVIPLSGADCTI